MSELERDLRGLAEEVDWPDMPPLELRLEPAVARPRARRRRALVLALAAVLVAVAIAFAVPPARSAILDFFHLGGVSVERVETLPPAAERPLAAGLGTPVDAAGAELVLGAPMALPPTQGDPQLYQRNGVVSAVLATPEPVLLSEFRPDFGGSVLKKLSASSAVESVRIDDEVEGLWIAGDQHVVFWLEAPPRLAGNVLVWERDGITYRIEGKTLTRERALELARALL